MKVMIKESRKKVRSIFLLIFAAVFVISCENKHAPTDKELKYNFKENSQVFEKYVDIFLNHKGLNRIEASPVASKMTLRSNIDTSDYLDDQEVLSDMKEKLKVDLISVNAFKDAVGGPISEISFYSFRVGLVTGGNVKGISYFKYSKPKIIKADLDKYDQPNSGRFLKRNKAISWILTSAF